MKTKKGIKLLVAVSDIHCGSEVGLMPPLAETKSGNVITFGSNFHQQWLWACWTAALDQVAAIAGKDKFALLINGDATEGIHHRDTAVVAAAIEDHTAMALECLRPLAARARHTMVTLGTECHTLGMENVLAEKLKAVGGKALGKWLFTMNGVRCDATHHIGVTSRVYLEASQMSIAMQNARLNSLRTDQMPARVFYRGHRHCGGYYSDGDSLIAITGGFQMLTRHGRKVVPDAIPRPAVIVHDYRDKPEGALPVTHCLTFNPPEDACLSL